MSTSAVNELKKFEGQPWSAWTDFLGCTIPPETEEDISDTFSNSCSKDISGSMRLNKSDMGIYGQYPGAEAFELAVCDFCGDKFKLAALADHIALRHADGKKVPAVDLSSVVISSKAKMLQLHLQKKGKTKYNKHCKEQSEKLVAVPTTNKLKTKLAITDEKFKPVSSINEGIIVDSTSVKQEKIIKTDQRTISTLLRQETTNLKNLKLKLRKTKETSDVSAAKVISLKLANNPSWIPNVNPILDLPILAKTKDKPKDTYSKKSFPAKPDTSQEPLPAPIKSPDVSKPSDEIAMMQPVVKLSPLDYFQVNSRAPCVFQDQKCRLKNDKKIISVKDRSYNPDRHCGVVVKDNTKPCTRSLTCKSHSMSLRRAVRGRSKAFDMLLADHRAEKEIFKRKLMENSDSDSVLQSPSEIVITTSSSPSNIISHSSQKGETKFHKMKNKNSRHPVSDYSRLSLPVSIKNPNIFSSLHNQSEKVKSNYKTAHISSSAVRLLGASSILKKPTFSPILSLQENGPGTEVAAHSPTSDNQPSVSHTHKSFPLKAGTLQPWHPGFRKSNGLLYSNNQIPRFNEGSPSKTENSAIVESVPVQNVPLTASLVTAVHRRYRNNPTQLSTSPHHSDVKRIPVLIESGKKNAVILTPEQATSLLMPAITFPGQSLLNHQFQKKSAGIPVTSSQLQTGVLLCQNSVSVKSVIGDDAISIPQKRLKRDIKVNIVGPILSKSNVGNTVTRFSIANGVFEKEAINSTGATGCRSLPPGVSLLQNNSVRLPTTQRVHYVTSSGPLPVTLQQFPQLQLKPVEVNSPQMSPNLKLIAPNVTVTSEGMVLIKKEQSD